MSWIKALDILFKAKSVKDQVDEVKKVYDYAKKFEKADPNKLEWDDLKYFNNKTMDKATAAMRALEKNTKAALKAELEWPTSGSLEAFVAASKVAEKNGVDSPQAKKAIDRYVGTLKDYDKALNSLAKDIRGKSTEIDEQIKILEALREYARVLHDAFMNCAKVPSFAGTAQNAMFFSLSQDAQQYGGIAGSVVSNLKDLAKKNDAYVKEVEQKVKDNQLWIDWATKDALSKEGNLEKNKKATKPKK